MFGIFTLLYSIVFFLNALVILHDKRFLTHIRLPLSAEHRAYIGPRRQKIVDIINTVRTVFELPLIIINLVYIIYEIFLG